MIVSESCFDKNDNCVDVLSFDPGLTNAGVVHVRIDCSEKRFCVLHAAIVDVLDPLTSFSKAAPVAPVASKRRTKPAKVEPFAHTWPGALDFNVRVSNAHQARLKRARAQAESNAAQKLTFADRVALLPWALSSVPWLSAAESSADVVLVEVQDPQNPQMRAVGHAVQVYYEAQNAARAAHADEPLPLQRRVEYVSSRLKLSDAVLMALDAALHFEHGANNESEDASLSTLVSRRSHAAKKSSAVQVFKALERRAPRTHPFFNWAASQRTTKHNAFDALLQAWSWMLENGVGFERAQLIGARRQCTRTAAAARRAAAKTAAAGHNDTSAETATLLEASNPPAAAAAAASSLATAPSGDTKNQRDASAPPAKRRRINAKPRRAVVPIELD